MDDLISRAAAIELIESRQRELCPVGMFGRNAIYGTDREKFDHWQEIIDEIEELPTVDATPHGQWEERHVDCLEESNIDAWQSAKCTNCGKYHTTPYLYYFHDYKFCPNCGAKMDGE